jgi:hypothetical protein
VNFSHRRAVLFAALGLGAVSAAAAPVMGGLADAASTSPGLQVSVFASGSGTLSQPDDISALHGDIFAAWQNGVGSKGEPAPGGGTTSELVEYDSSGSTVNQWALMGKVDGFTADARSGMIVVTVNEDGNSSLYTVNPSAPPNQQVTHYLYNLNPLPHGGGTDSVAVLGGQIFISASAPTVPTGPALYRVTLEAPTAVVQPVFFDNSPARIANTNLPNQGRMTTLALTDPDSSEVVPTSSSRFGGQLVVDSQGDQQQIYLSDPGGNTPALSVLALSQAVDDSAWVTSAHGVLYATDGSDNEIFAIRGAFIPGTVYTSVTPSDANKPVNTPGYLGVLNLDTGTIAPAVTTFQPKGLLFMA